MAKDVSGAARVGKYLMLDTLGEGAFGKVRLAVDETSGFEYAIKIMDKSHIKANELTLQVRREIAVMKAMTHPNIVNLHGVLTSSKNLYMVMDLVTGGELFDAVAERGRLPEALARSYFQQLVDGIHYCHSRRVYHRDLKPENLLLTADKKTIKITDFGLSSIKAENAASELLHTIMGSPHYIAPEIITSAEKGYDGAKVDVWASGIILFGMLAGYLPFDETATRALYKAIVHNAVKFPPHFSYDCVKLLRAMLQKDPSRRPTMEQVKTFQWFKLDYQPAVVEESKESTPESSHRKKGKHRAKKAHRHSKKKDAQTHTPARSENELSADNLPQVASPSCEAADALNNNGFNTRSSIVVELRTTSLEEAEENKQHGSEAASRRAGKENRDPSASFLSAKQAVAASAQSGSNREPLMPLSTSANQSCYSQRASSTSIDALRKHGDSAVSDTLHDVDEHFDKLDCSVNSAEERAFALRSATTFSGGLEDSFDAVVRSVKAPNSVASDKQASLKQSQGSVFCDSTNQSGSNTMRNSSHSEATSMGNSSSGLVESTKSAESHSASLEPRTPSLDKAKQSSSHSSPVCSPQHENKHRLEEKGLPPSLRVVDEEERHLCFEEPSQDPGTHGFNQKAELNARLSDETFEPASAQAFISPVSWNPNTVGMYSNATKTPTASRGKKFPLAAHLDSPISEGSLFSKANKGLEASSTPRTDGIIFKPIKPRFEKLATAQTPKTSQRKSGAPSVFSPELGEELDRADDWNIDSASVFADVETDDGSESFTPMSEASVSTPNTRWKFKSVLARTTNNEEDSRKSIFAPLRLHISDKLSPSNK